MSPRWLLGKQASIGGARRHRQERCEPTICCTRGCFSLRTCCTHVCPKTWTRSCGRMPWLRSLSREFSAGCLLRVIRLQPCSNAWRFACVCAVAYWLHLLIFCDSLFPPRKKIGKWGAKSATTVCSTHCAAHSAWRASMAATERLIFTGACRFGNFGPEQGQQNEDDRCCHYPQPLRLSGELFRQLRGVPKRLFLRPKNFRKALRCRRRDFLKRRISIHGLQKPALRLPCFG